MRRRVKQGIKLKHIVICEWLSAFAGCYAQGGLGMPQDWPKSNELLLKAGGLGCTEAYYNLGNSYYNGDGVEIDKKRKLCITLNLRL